MSSSIKNIIQTLEEKAYIAISGKEIDKGIYGFPGSLRKPNEIGEDMPDFQGRIADVDLLELIDLINKAYSSSIAKNVEDSALADIYLVMEKHLPETVLDKVKYWTEQLRCKDNKSANCLCEEKRCNPERCDCKCHMKCDYEKALFEYVINVHGTSYWLPFPLTLEELRGKDMYNLYTRFRTHYSSKYKDALIKCIKDKLATISKYLENVCTPLMRCWNLLNEKRSELLGPPTIEEFLKEFLRALDGNGENVAHELLEELKSSLKKLDLYNLDIKRFLRTYSDNEIFIDNKIFRFKADDDSWMDQIISISLTIINLAIKVDSDIDSREILKKLNDDDGVSLNGIVHVLHKLAKNEKFMKEPLSNFKNLRNSFDNFFEKKSFSLVKTEPYTGNYCKMLEKLTRFIVANLQSQTDRLVYSYLNYIELNYWRNKKTEKYLISDTDEINPLLKDSDEDGLGAAVSSYILYSLVEYVIEFHIVAIDERGFKLTWEQVRLDDSEFKFDGWAAIAVRALNGLIDHVSKITATIWRKPESIEFLFRMLIRHNKEFVKQLFQIMYSKLKRHDPVRLQTSVAEVGRIRDTYMFRRSAWMR